MSVTFQQTDTAITGACQAALCSGNSNSTGGSGGQLGGCQAAVGGTAGSTPQTVVIDASGADLNAVWIECIIPAGYDWTNDDNSGNWTININVSTGNHQLTLDEIHVCRVNSSCVNQESVASSTLIGQNIATAQVYTFNVAQGADLTGSAGDKAVVIFAFDNAQTMEQSFGFTPSETIVAPGSAAQGEFRGVFPAIAYGAMRWTPYGPGR